MADLPTNYLDDILAESMNGKRKYRITRADGTFEEVTLEDVSEYEQVGSTFGASDINKTNQAVNEKFDSDDVVDPKLATEEGFAADAKLTGDALSELNKNFVKNILTFTAGTTFPNIVSRVYTQNDMLCLKLGGYSNVYLCSDNQYVVGTVENLPIVGNRFFTGVISDANGTKTSPVSLILYSDGVVVLFTYGINLDDNTYNVLNVSVML